MKQQISRAEAEELLHRYLKTEYLLKHSLESAVIMEKLAEHFAEDQDAWYITGLLHDLDMDRVGPDYEGHGEKTLELLKAEGYDLPVLFNAILSHTEGVEGSRGRRSSRLDYCLAAAENITGLISAYVLMKPDKKIAGTKVKSIQKKLRDRSFAAKVSREFIQDITVHTGLEQQAFIAISLSAMESIAERIGM